MAALLELRVLALGDELNFLVERNALLVGVVTSPAYNLRPSAPARTSALSSATPRFHQSGLYYNESTQCKEDDLHETHGEAP